ncbi:MAG: hypothetical protein AAGA48_31185 [Myxococcota bacterium]
MVSRMLLVFGLACLVGCEKPPVYQDIAKVIVHQQTGARGTQKTELRGEQFERAIQCLYSTQQVTEKETKDELLQAIVVLQVVDRIGDRMFELYTTENFKGNKGKYYRNSCIYSIIER